MKELVKEKSSNRQEKVTVVRKTKKKNSGVGRI